MPLDAYVSKCQLADLIEEAIMRGGFKPHTRPRVWMSQFAAPLVGGSVPMTRGTRADRRMQVGTLGSLLPLVATAYVFSLPVDWLRARRAKKNNEGVRTALDDAVTAPRPTGGYRQLARPGGGWTAEIAQADEVVVADYRIEERARLRFCGTALFALRGSDQQLLSLTVHRAVPSEGALDAVQVAERLASLTSAPVEQHHWEWELRDTYGLTERDTCPW